MATKYVHPISKECGFIPSIDISKIQLPVDISQTVGSTLYLNESLPGLIKGEPTALLLDVNNLYKRAQANGFKIDYARLLSVFKNRCDVRYSAAYSAIDPDNTHTESWIKYMTNTGFEVITKDLKRYTDHTGSLITKGNMDVEITMGALDLDSGFGHIVIGSCDGDFVALLDRLREGKLRKVSVLGMSNEDGTGMSRSLIDAADHFYDLSGIKDFIKDRRHNE